MFIVVQEVLYLRQQLLDKDMVGFTQILEHWYLVELLYQLVSRAVMKIQAVGDMMTILMDSLETHQMTELSEQLEDITEEMEKLEQQYSSVSGEISQQREDVQEKEELVGKLNAELEQQQGSLQEHRATHTELEERHRELEREFIEANSHLSGLLKIRESFKPFVCNG